MPSSFASQTVVGKGHDTGDEDGRALWDAVTERAALDLPEPSTAATERYGAPVLVRPRLGQGAFRVLVTDAYGRRCSVSGEKTLPILDAADIRSYADGGLTRALTGCCSAPTSISYSTWAMSVSMRIGSLWSAIG